MQTLLTLFSKERSELQSELDKTTSLKQAVRLVENRLDRLEKTYVGELSVAQVRLVKFFLDTLRQSLATLATANETETANFKPEQFINQTTRFSSNFILKLLQGIISLSILVSLFSLTQTDPGVWLPILLVSALIGLEVALQLDKNKLAQTSSLQVLPASEVRIDNRVLLDNLAEALNTIDRAVAQAEEANKPLAASGIEELTEILDILQRLMGASFLNNPLLALELTKLIGQILLKQGILAQTYQPNDAHSRGYFDFEPSIDPAAKDYITVTPALLKGEKLLLRGRVIEPADAKANA